MVDHYRALAPAFLMKMSHLYSLDATTSMHKVSSWFLVRCIGTSQALQQLPNPKSIREASRDRLGGRSWRQG